MITIPKPGKPKGQVKNLKQITLLTTNRQTPSLIVLKRIGQDGEIPTAFSKRCQAKPEYIRYRMDSIENRFDKTLCNRDRHVRSN